MDKIQEVKQKLNSYRGNRFLVGEDIHETAIDALNVITEQEKEIDRKNCEIRQLYERILEIEETKGRVIEAEKAATRRARRAAIRQTEINEKLHRIISATNEKAFRRAAEIKELSEKLENAEGLRVTMVTVAEDRKIENARLKDELTAAKNEVTAAKTAASFAETKVSALKNETKRLNAELETAWKNSKTNYDRYVSAANEVGRARKALENEQEKCSGFFKEKFDLSVKCYKLTEKLENAEAELEEKKEELATAKKELGESRDKLIEMTAKASSVVINADEVDTIHFRPCPVCHNGFRFFIKRSVPVEVTGESPRKYANCPRCKEPVNDFDNKIACGRCGTPLDWGDRKIDKE